VAGFELDRISWTLGTAGITLAVLVQSWPFVLVGFAMVGLGTANIIPIIFGVSGRIGEGAAGPSLATVTTLGYFGFLSGPPVIGLLAAYASLPVAFVLVIIFSTIIATLGVKVIRPAMR
jgi:MFS family permease